MSAGEVFVIQDTGAETNRTHTSENDRGLSGAALLAQGDWAGQWSSPELTIPSNGLILAGYSDMIRQSGTQRSGAACQFALNGSLTGIAGATSWGYVRYAGSADEASRHGAYFANLSANDVIKVREGTQLNGSDRVGDYNRTSGDPRGLWAVDFGTDKDYLITEITGTDEGSGNYGNSPRPIDLGSPSSLSSGSWKKVTFDNTVASSGSTIARYGDVLDIAANSLVLVYFTYQILGVGGRRNLLMRADKDGVPYCYTSVYNRDSNSDEVCGSMMFLMKTGGSAESLNFYFVNQEETATIDVDIQEARCSVIDLTGQDCFILGKTDSDITDMDNSWRQVSFPSGDEINVDASFDHPVGNLTRIENDAGETITVLVGACALWDRSGTSSGIRVQPAHQLTKTGTNVDYAIWSEYSRGQQGDDDTFIAGSSFGAPVELGTSDYIELSYKDLAENGGGDQVVLNCTDGAAILYWGVRLDDMSGDTTPTLSVDDSTHALSYDNITLTTTGRVTLTMDGQEGETIFDADFEDGTLDYFDGSRGEIFGKPTSNDWDISVVASPAIDNYSAAITIESGSDVSGYLFSYTVPTGDVAHYYCSYYLESGERNPYLDAWWWNVWQHKSSNNTYNKPVIDLEIQERSGTEQIVMNHWVGGLGSPTTYTQGTPVEFPRDTWVELHVEYYMASDATGYVIVYQDDVEIFRLEDIVTKPGGDNMFWSIQSYSSPSQQVTIHVDNIQQKEDSTSDGNLVIGLTYDDITLTTEEGGTLHEAATVLSVDSELTSSAELLLEPELSLLSDSSFSVTAEKLISAELSLDVDSGMDSIGNVNRSSSIELQVDSEITSQSHLKLSGKSVFEVDSEAVITAFKTGTQFASMSINANSELSSSAQVALSGALDVIISSLMETSGGLIFNPQIELDVDSELTANGDTSQTHIGELSLSTDSGLDVSPSLVLGGVLPIEACANGAFYAKIMLGASAQMNTLYAMNSCSFMRMSGAMRLEILSLLITAWSGDKGVTESIMARTYITNSETEESHESLDFTIDHGMKCDSNVEKSYRTESEVSGG